MHKSPEFLKVNFVKEKEEAYKRIYQRLPIVSSASVGWDFFGIAYDWYPVDKLPKIISKQHSIAIFTDVPSPIKAKRLIDGRFKREEVVQGNCVIIPANISQQVEGNKDCGALMLAIDPTTVAQTIYEVVNPDTIELLPQFATPDPFLHQIGIALKAALFKQSDKPNGDVSPDRRLKTTGDAAASRASLRSRLYAETLVNSLILHLLEHYTTTRPNLCECIAGQLPQYKLHQVIDYINAYLDRDLSLKELSDIVRMSPHYFSQLFKGSMNITPHQYVIRCRVERAKDLLRLGKLSIAEIATQVGFVDQSHLYRYFKRIVGVTPKTYKQSYK